MSPGRLDAELVRRHLLALDKALANLRRYQGRPLESHRLLNDHLQDFAFGQLVQAYLDLDSG